MNHVRLFKGGLGDIVAHCFLTDSYVLLDELRAGDTMTAIFASPNYCAREIVTHHPNVGRIKVIQLPTSTNLDAVAHGISTLEDVPVPDLPLHRGNRLVTFYPSTSDVDALQVLGGDRYVIFALSSGSVSHVISEDVSPMAIEAAQRHGFRVAFIGRNYPGHREKRPLQAGAIDLIDRLSVHGTLRAIQKSAGVFTAFSSPLLMAHFMGRPFFATYPPAMEWEIPVFRSRIYDGRNIDLKHCYKFGKVTPENLDLFFSEL